MMMCVCECVQVSCWDLEIYKFERFITAAIAVKPQLCMHSCDFLFRFCSKFFIFSSIQPHMLYESLQSSKFYICSLCCRRKDFFFFFGFSFPNSSNFMLCIGLFPFTSQPLQSQFCLSYKPLIPSTSTSSIINVIATDSERFLLTITVLCAVSVRSTFGALYVQYANNNANNHHMQQQTFNHTIVRYLLFFHAFVLVFVFFIATGFTVIFFLFLYSPHHRCHRFNLKKKEKKKHFYTVTIQLSL